MSLLRTISSLNILRKNICSTAVLCEFKYKVLDLKALHHHAMEDPNCGKEATSIGIPDTMGEALGKRRYEILCQLYGEDAFEEKIKKMNTKATKENPNLVPCDNWRRMNGCLCTIDQTGVFWLQLYRNFPIRCSCGYWLELVSFEEYYQRKNALREKKYNEIKSSPDFLQLEGELEKYQSEFSELATGSKNMTVESPGALEIMAKMSDRWKNLIGTRKKIEALLDE